MGEEFLLPWSCCSPEGTSLYFHEQPAMANTIRGRLLAKAAEEAEEAAAAAAAAAAAEEAAAEETEGEEVRSYF